jgi:hypothetical protein
MQPVNDQPTDQPPKQPSNLMPIQLTNQRTNLMTIQPITDQPADRPNKPTKPTKQNET